MADDIAEEIDHAPFMAVAVSMAVASIIIIVAMVTVGGGLQAGALTGAVLIVAFAVGLICRRRCKYCRPEEDEDDEEEEEEEEVEEPANGGFYSDLQVHKQEVHAIKKLTAAAEEEKAKAAKPSCLKAIKNLLFPEPEGEEHLGEAEMELRLMQAGADPAAGGGAGAGTGGGVGQAGGKVEEVPVVTIPWERICELILEPLQVRYLEIHKIARVQGEGEGRVMVVVTITVTVTIAVSQG